MDLGLAGKTVIVTGGGSNIGRGISLIFGEEGANVVIADLDLEQGEKVAKLIISKGGKAVAIKTDVTNVESVNSMVKSVKDKFGKIEILVNNVGWESVKPFIGKPEEEWQKEIKINYHSAIYCVSAVVPHMIEQKYGKIVSIASDAGRVGENMGAVYAGCKGAIIAFSKSMVLELSRYGININVVCPAIIVPQNLAEEVGKASMSLEPAAEFLRSKEIMDKIIKVYPLRRLGTAADIGNMVAFVASDKCNYVTGQTISVDGGFTMI